MDLSIDCAVEPTDTLEVFDTANGHLAFQVESGDAISSITMNQESATKLRDALTDWLGGEV